MKQQGFTIIELLICIAIVGIIAAAALGDGTLCRKGFLFETTHGRQLISESGGGIACGVSQR